MRMLSLKILTRSKSVHKFYHVLLQSVIMVYCVLRKQNVDVYFSRLQCVWKLTEWANFMLAYETELY